LSFPFLAAFFVFLTGAPCRVVLLGLPYAFLVPLRRVIFSLFFLIQVVGAAILFSSFFFFLPLRSFFTLIFFPGSFLFPKLFFPSFAVFGDQLARGWPSCQPSFSVLFA